MRRFSLLIVPLLLLICTSQVRAQLGREQDNLQNGVSFQWKVVSSGSVDVYYHSADHLLGQQVVKFAENALYDLSILLDYRNKSRFAIYLYNSPYDFIQSNRYEEQQYKEPGKTPIENNSVSLVYPGSVAELEEKTRAQVARLLMREFYYGGGVQISVQNNVLLHTPLWFYDGFCDYLGEGWDYEDELWTGGLNNQNLIELAIEGDGEINNKLRKSIWHFVVATYGKEKLSELFYMTRLTRSVESGVITVLGITLKTMTDRWREFMIRKMTLNKELRVDFTKQARQVPLKKTDRLLATALNPVSPQIAVYILRNGVHKVLLYDYEKRVFTDTDIKGGFVTNQLEGMSLKPAMAWSHDGKFLLTTIFKGRRDQMALFTPNKPVQYIHYNKTFDRLLSLSWSHDGKTVVCSGLRLGQTDLYTFKPGTANFKEITKDTWDDLSPVFSKDDQTLIFASNRAAVPSEDAALEKKPGFDAYKNKTDLYSIAISGEKDSWRKITSTPEIAETPLLAYSSFEIDYLTDASGIFNLARRNIFLGDSVNLTNIEQGFYQLSHSEKKLAFITTTKGKLALFEADVEGFLEPSAFFATELKQTIISFRLQEEKLIRKVFEEEENSGEEEIYIAKEDETADTASSENGVKYYVFDEEEDDYNPRGDRKLRRFQRSILQNSAEIISKKPNFDTLFVKSPRRARPQWAADFVTIRFGFAPPHFGTKFSTALNFHMEGGIKDLAGDHDFRFGVRPYFFNLKSYDIFANYTYRKYKVDIKASADYFTRHFFNESFQLRYSWLNTALAFSYPFNRYTSVAARVTNTFVQRRDLFLLEPTGLDGIDMVPGAGINFLFNNTKTINHFTWSGLRAELDINSTFSAAEKNLNFISVRTDIRKYTRVFKKMVFATRLAAGFTTGPNPQLFMMGGADNWMISGIQNGGEMPYDQKLASAAFMEFVTPIRGFKYNARNGTKYVAINAELRIPLNRMLARFLNSSPIYNLELIPFFDIGTVWEKGNPLSQKNPINNEPINAYPLVINVQTLKSPFLMGFGAGMRVNTLGYSFRADIAWGMEDNTVMKPKLHLSLAKNF